MRTSRAPTRCSRPATRRRCCPSLVSVSAHCSPVRSIERRANSIGRSRTDDPMTLRTRLTERLGIEHPVISAPMGFVSGGNLAAKVTAAGGLGMIGGGYGDAEWLEREFAAAGNTRVGCGFITWSLAKQPHLLEQTLAHA